MKADKKKKAKDQALKDMKKIGITILFRIEKDLRLIKDNIIYLH